MTWILSAYPQTVILKALDVPNPVDMLITVIWSSLCSTGTYSDAKRMSNRVEESAGGK